LAWSPGTVVAFDILGDQLLHAGHRHANSSSCSNQRSNQTQQLLLFWAIAGGYEESSDLNVGGLTA
jgi:hypothetical protein